MLNTSRNLGFSNCFTIDTIGNRGGLALMWSSDTKLEIQHFSRFHIHSMISEEKSGLEWFLTRFYGQPETSKLSASWELFDTINRGPCLVGV